MKQWRFIHSGFCHPFTNMAIDEAILIMHGLGRTPPTLRLYGWRPPAFSLGYFQSAKEALNLEKCRKHGVLFVRRITGGGIIFHDDELSYSLTCFRDEIKVFGPVKETFIKICSFLLNAYRKLGLKPHFLREIKRFELKKSDFCSASYQDYDIVIDGKKIGGNAQKRKKDLIFQHGSIPLSLKIDTFLPFLKNGPENLKERVYSLEDVLERKITFMELSEIIRKSFEETFSIHLIRQDLTTEERELSIKLKDDKYSRLDWNLRR